MGKPEAPKRLFEESSDDDENDDNDEKSEKKQVEEVVKINKKFAQDFELRKQTEELRQVCFRDKKRNIGGDDDDLGSDASIGSSSSTEDEDAELLTTKLDVDIITTINALRSKDSTIYDPNKRFFHTKVNDDDDDDDSMDGTRRQKEKPKPKRYKDVVREQILEKIKHSDNSNSDVESSDSDEDHGAIGAARMKTSRLAYDATQQEFRQAFLESTKDSDDDEVIVLKGKKQSSAKTTDGGTDDTDNEVETEKQLFVELERLKKNTKNDDRLADPRGEIADGQTFLLNFFQNRPWLKEKQESDSDEEDGDHSIDGEDDCRKSAAEQSNHTSAVDSKDDDDDASSLHELEEAEEFEAAYNFRFEQEEANGEPPTTASGAQYSNVAYARRPTVPTLRRKDDSRSLARKARLERKAMERQQKEEQLKRLKNAKRQEMDLKLRHVQAVLGQVPSSGSDGGVDEAAILKLLEGDFDPEKFEALMQETYNDDFYNKQDEEWADDQAVRKSLLQPDVDIVDGEMIAGVDDADGGLYDTVDGPESEALEGDDNDEDYEDQEEEWLEPDGDQTSKEESEIERKVKAKIEEELYKLDYEDIVAGMPTRFKYRKVEPNNYGLSTKEILIARDSTLKQFVSLKKLAPYADAEYFVGSKKRRRFREMLKSDLEEEMKSADQNETSTEAELPSAEEGTKKKRRRLKKGSKRKDEVGKLHTIDTTTDPSQMAVSGENIDKQSKIEEKLKKRSRRKKSGVAVMTEEHGQVAIAHAQESVKVGDTSTTANAESSHSILAQRPADAVAETKKNPSAMPLTTRARNGKRLREYRMCAWQRMVF